MAEYPIDPTLQKSYRDTLSIPSSPARISDDIAIVPVAIVAQTSTVTGAQFVKPTDGTNAQKFGSDGGILPTKGNLPSGATFVSKTLGETSIASAGTATIYTVTAGKTFYLTSMSIGTGSSGLVELDIRDAAGGAGMVNAYMSAQAATSSSQTYSFPTPVPFTTSVVVKNNGGTAMFTAISIQGYEV